jgi:hypothetical protein
MKKRSIIYSTATVAGAVLIVICGLWLQAAFGPQQGAFGLGQQAQISQSTFSLTSVFNRISRSLQKICPSIFKPSPEEQILSTHKHIAFVCKDGPVLVAQVVAGPFDLHRKYLSMEGPFVNWKCNVASLVASDKILLPPSRVRFTETSGVNSMSGQVTHLHIAQNKMSASKNSAQNPKIEGLVRLRGRPRQLYWLKGIELKVIDENGKILPTAEFICHFNLDVDTQFRSRTFGTGSSPCVSRIISLTQGQTKFFFPDGYAVPVASNERLSLGFQAANRTSNKHRRIKHICSLYFLKDTDTTRPVQALQWDCPFLAVALKKCKQPANLSEHCEAGSCCLSYIPGAAAPNSRGLSRYSDMSRGAKSLSGHWVVPCGTHTFRAPYYAPLASDDFITYPRTIHAVWCHVHPLCTQASLIERSGIKRKELFTVHVKTRTHPGLEIMNIENICSEQGIPLAGTNSGKQYELEAVYQNTTGKPQDSMVSIGIFATNDKFRKPDWAQ